MIRTYWKEQLHAECAGKDQAYFAGIDLSTVLQS